MTAGVYKIDAADGKCYIGSSINVEKRLRGHRYRLNSGKHKNRLLRAAWRKSDGCLNFSLLIVCSVENLLLYEQLAIDAFKPALNICPIAGNSLGVKRTEETRQLLSDRLSGRQLSENHKASISKGLLGRVHSEITKEKIGAKNRGSKHTDIAKVKMLGRKASDKTKQFQRERALGNSYALGHKLPASTKSLISTKLTGRERSPGSIAKQRETCARKRLEMTDKETS